MLQDIKDLQQEAVTKLVNVLSDTPKKEVTFKAPTGSGKTYMMADFIIEEIGKANKLIESLFLTNTHESAKEIYLNLKHMGLSSEIVID